MNVETISPADSSAHRHVTIFVLSAVFLSSAGFGIVMPVMPDLIKELAHSDLSHATKLAAWIGAVYAICQFVLGPTMGNLGDRFGRRPVILLSLLGFSIDFLLTGLAPNIGWLFVARAIAGGLGAIFAPSNAAMADIHPPEKRAAAFGMVGGAFGLGFIFGPVLGGFLGEYGARIPFYVASAMSMSVFLYGLFFLPETMPESRKRAFDWKRANPLGALLVLRREKSFLPLAGIYFLWATAINAYASSWSFYAKAQFGWSSKMIGVSLALVGISMAVSQVALLSRFITRFGERKTALIGMCYGVFSFAINAFVTQGWIIMAFALTNGFHAMVTPSLNAMMSRRLPADQQGELQGFNGSMAAISFLFAQIVYNNLLAYFTSKDAPVYFPGVPFLLCMIFSVIAMFALYKLPKTDVSR